MDDDRYPDRADDARLVDAVRAGDERAFGTLYDRWYDRVYRLALGVVRQPDVAAEVAQESFLSAWRGLDRLEDPRAFGGWLLRIARNGALNRRAKEQRSRPVDDAGLGVIEATGASPSDAPAGFGVEDRLSRLDDPAAVAEQSELQALVWSAVGALPERDAEVLDLQLRFGMAPAEIGEILGLNRNAANQLVHRVRARFETAVRARVLWRGDDPACADLARLLAAAGVRRFDAEAVKIAERHAPSCAECADRRELRLQPAAMFAAIPLLAAPIIFKQQAAGAMELAGVSMQGSAFSTGLGGSTGGSAVGSSAEASGAWSRGAKIAAMVLVAMVVVGAAVAVLASGTREGNVSDVALATTLASTAPGSVGPSPTTSTRPATPSSLPEVTPSSVLDTTAPTTTTTVAPLVGSIGLSASSLAANGGAAPTLTWSVSGPGAWTVSVTGFVIEGTKTVPATAPTGSGVVCPGALTGTRCVPSGRLPAYDYVLTVVAPDGSVLLTRRVTLTIT